MAKKKRIKKKKPIKRKKAVKKKPVKKKKVAKKKTVRRRKPRQPGVMAIIPYEEIAKPETYQGKYTLVPTAFTKTQIAHIIAPTPAHIIKYRKGKGGGQWAYIPGWWFKKRLNFIFGFDGWDTTIDGERIDGEFITVKGKLIIKATKARKEITSKTDYGGAEIKYWKGKAHTPANYLDISNDFKAAQTDLIKRCCIQLGIGMDVYGKAESIDAGQVVVKTEKEPKKPKGSEKIEEGEIEEIAPKSDELKRLLKGKTAREKLADLKKLTGVNLTSLNNVTEEYASRLIGFVLKAQLNAKR